MTSTFHTLLAGRKALLADGATGTNLFKMGLGPGEPPEPWNLHRPLDTKALYRGPMNAGSDLFLTNSFGGTRYRLKLHNLEGEVRELNKAAAALGREVAAEADRPVIVAGSMGPTGEMYEPLGALTEEAAEAAYFEQAEALRDGGADVLWIETIFSFEEMRAAVRAAKRTGLPVCVTMSFDSAGRTMMGISPQSLVREAAALGVDAFGANCGRGAPDLVATILGFFSAEPQIPVIAKGNCGIPEFKGGEISYSGTEAVMAEYLDLVFGAGARIIGGCCGTTPSHITAMRKALDRCLQAGAVETTDLAAIEARLGAISEGAKRFALSEPDPENEPARQPRGRNRRGKRA